MEFIDEQLSNYVGSHTAPESDILKKLNRETWTTVTKPRMLSGHLQGRVLSTFSNMIKPERVLEVGTYTGYSAICLAEGLAKGGKIFTIDINEELESMVRSYLEQSGVTGKVEFLLGNAVDIIPTLNEEFDLVFIDADKENYSNYFNLVLPKVKKGGFIIADNVLWSGKVLEDVSQLDDESRSIVDFNELVHNSRYGIRI